MKAVDQLNDNDYAVAREFNLLAMEMIMNIYLAHKAGISPNETINELNRAYILVVDELEKLYDQNPKLAALEPEPIWRDFDVLKSHTRQIIKHISNPDNDYGNTHYAKVEKLCILANIIEPQFTPEQKELYDHAKSIVDEYFENIDDAFEHIRSIEENNWQIPVYELTYKPDGTLLVNDVLKLKKAHAGSTTERLLEQAVKRPNELFKPDLGHTARNISTILNSAGFTTTLRQLFFPTVSNSNGIVFRQTITRNQADDDNINTQELDLTLKKLGAIIEPKSTN